MPVQFVRAKDKGMVLQMDLDQVRERKTSQEISQRDFDQKRPMREPWKPTVRIYRRWTTTLDA